MGKQKTTYACGACGQTFAKWLGRCTACGEWGSVDEALAAPPPAPSQGLAPRAPSEPQRLREVEGAPPARASTGIGELDRVLGGGLVPGALVLVGGDPGIGKSTLLLQASDRIARFGVDVLYVTGEESARQTRMRFDRIGAGAESLWLVAETALARIEHHVARLDPRVLVIDSVQTLHADDTPGAPGSVGQLRAITARLMALAKGREIVTFLVGHVTKEGNLAGPRLLEHMVDTVLYLQGQRGHPFRLLRAVKNRFGSTDEIGAFEMRGDGLCEVDNPSALFLAERAAGASGSVVAASFEGTRPLLVEVQALVTPTAYGTPRRTAIGFDHNRTALLLAVLEKKAGLDIGGDVFVNVASGITLDEPAADLAVIAALASSHNNRPLHPKVAVFGEVGLGGEIRGVIGADARVIEARRLGFDRILLPTGNQDAARLVGEQGLIPVSTVDQALAVMFD
ncbi:MAG: DNA repair protein RadA [bacterium]